VPCCWALVLVGASALPSRGRCAHEPVSGVQCTAPVSASASASAAAGAPKSLSGVQCSASWSARGNAAAGAPMFPSGKGAAAGRRGARDEPHARCCSVFLHVPNHCAMMFHLLLMRSSSSTAVVSSAAAAVCGVFWGEAPWPLVVVLFTHAAC
jgi:hypothetical protein